MSSHYSDNYPFSHTLQPTLFLNVRILLYVMAPDVSTHRFARRYRNSPKYHSKRMADSGQHPPAVSFRHRVPDRIKSEQSSDLFARSEMRGRHRPFGWDVNSVVGRFQFEVWSDLGLGNTEWLSEVRQEPARTSMAFLDRSAANGCHGGKAYVILGATSLWLSRFVV